MGYAKEKYTKTYFLKQDSDGKPTPYGVEGIEEFRSGGIRPSDREILAGADFRGRAVLEFGFGRGEAAKYCAQHDAARYTGVDFSEDACSIAREFLARHGLQGLELLCDDALNFVSSWKGERFDIVLMLDFIEHVPRGEMRKILQAMRDMLNPGALVLVNTPVFREDNDIITDGIKPQSVDPGDNFKETSGMHCSRFSKHSLREFFSGEGYSPVSEGHYFAFGVKDVSFAPSFRIQWEQALAAGTPLSADWRQENFEYVFPRACGQEWRAAKTGPLAGHDFFIKDNAAGRLVLDPDYAAPFAGAVSSLELDGKAVVDIGSGIGCHSVFLSERVGSGLVYSFEPDIFLSDRMKINLSRCETASKIIYSRVLLSGRDGPAEVCFFRDVDDLARQDGFHYYAGAEKSENAWAFEKISVQERSLDSLYSSGYFAEAPAFVRISASSHADWIIGGAKKLMRECSPVFLLELRDPAVISAVGQAFGSCGYDVLFAGQNIDGSHIACAYDRAKIPSAFAEWARKNGKAGNNAAFSSAYLKLLAVAEDAAAAERKLRDELEDNARLADENGKAHQLTTELYGKIAELSKETDSVRGAAINLTAERDAVTARLQEVSKELDSLRASAQTTRSERDEAGRLNAELYQKISALSSEQDVLRAAAVSATAEKEQLGKLSAGLYDKIAELSGELDTARASVASVSAEKEHFAKLYSELKARLDSVSEELESVRVTSASSGAERDRLGRLSSELYEKIASLSSELSATLSSAEASRNKAVIEADETRRVNAVVAEERQKAWNLCHELYGEIKKLTDRCEESAAQLDRIQRSLVFRAARKLRLVR